MMDPVNPASDSPFKPRIGISIGDPSGIGPEIVLKSVADDEVRSLCLPVIVGDAAELKRQESSCIVQQALPLQNVNHLPWESEAFRD